MINLCLHEIKVDMLWKRVSEFSTPLSYIGYGYHLYLGSPDEQVFQGRSVDASFKFDLPPHLIIQSSNIKLTETIGQGLQSVSLFCDQL